ncbi:early growth response protein 1-like [Artemia franciscana]|uniref:C2H2-type domain-containing protein n=1 Tax=Artemia franciscana TaxID=6661 RepID=A0AA88HYL5_ARTSF|nr:hypothetical protein QYM36_005107 [Artemia franciscana]
MTLSEKKSIFRPWDDPKEAQQCPLKRRDDKKVETKKTRGSDPTKVSLSSEDEYKLLYEQQIHHQNFIVAQQQMSLVGLSQQLSIPSPVLSLSDSASSANWKGLVDTLESLSPLQLASLGIEPSTSAMQFIHQAQRKPRPKKFRCPHCGVGFSNNGQLKGHIRSHTGERPFQCEVESCGKTFTRNEELTRHKRIHTGVRPYSCVQCGKKFGRRDHLKKHTRTHQRPTPPLMVLPHQLPLGTMFQPLSGFPPFTYNPMIL